jgi:anthranilate synthase/aminodeoxychorismate synthase-like glutamine amidotransferase
MHGKTSQIIHEGDPLFKDVPSPFTATRYHSLVVEEATLPDELIITAYTESGEIMGLRHRVYPVVGVQFHPESILTDFGMKILQNFLEKQYLLVEA